MKQNMPIGFHKIAVDVMFEHTAEISSYSQIQENKGI